MWPVKVKKTLWEKRNSGFLFSMSPKAVFISCQNSGWCCKKLFISVLGFTSMRKRVSCILNKDIKQIKAELHSYHDLRTEGHWFNPRLGQHSFRELKIVNVTGLIPLLPLSIVSKMVIWESKLGKNIVKRSG